MKEDDQRVIVSGCVRALLRLSASGPTHKLADRGSAESAIVTSAMTGRVPPGWIR